jgi:hypothetical protein
MQQTPTIRKEIPTAASMHGGDRTYMPPASGIMAPELRLHRDAPNRLTIPSDNHTAKSGIEE